MKIMLFAIVTLLSQIAQARQYIQCADKNSWDRSVVNLDGQASTLFMTNGVHLPDNERVEVLKDLFYKETTQTHEIYITAGHRVIETVKVPLSVIGKSTSNFPVEMGHFDTKYNYSRTRVLYCFSSIYE
ncbi:MAG: hypothetical protein ACPGJV_03840 [Bacteriovoracaceae bacterium]